MNKLHIILSWTASALIAAVPAIAHEGHEKAGDAASEQGKEVTVKGEVLDMACYIDHGATGAKHADCAKDCIAKGLPVGIKSDDGKTYLIIGEHKPLNAELADQAAKKITVKGKLTSSDGINMIENAEILK